MTITNLGLTELLRKEMVPALGCTEPIAIAYAAALVTKYLGAFPDRLRSQCSANIIKNTKSVIVPNSQGMKGIEAACILGAYAGNAEGSLEVLSDVNSEHIARCQTLLKQHIVTVEVLDSESTLHIIITGTNKTDTVSVEIRDGHTNVIKISKNGAVVFSNDDMPQEQYRHGYAGEVLSIDSIIHFSRSGNYDSLIAILDREIQYNSKISREGILADYGLSVGRTILKTTEDCVRNRAKAFAASGSDARMNGCDLPVIINSGSGNQGLTVSIPVIEYAKELGSSRDRLYRALILSNLIAIYEKVYIGKLSAYCGVVCAASGSAAGITMLKNGTDEQIKNAVTNTLGTLSGMICDGAKPSCASKIAACIDTAISCHEIAMNNQALSCGDGIIKSSLDKTIRMVGRLANQGMRETDNEILSIMLDKDGV